METWTTNNRHPHMTRAACLIHAIAQAEKALANARRNRLAAVQAFAKYAKQQILRHKLDRGTLRRRTGWPDYKLGNFLHLDYCLPPDDMAVLAEALRPLSVEERKAAKRQPKRTKALNS